MKFDVRRCCLLLLLGLCGMAHGLFVAPPMQQFRLKIPPRMVHKMSEGVAAVETVVEQGRPRIRSVKARRPDVEDGLRYRSNDWFINFLSMPNSFVLKRIRFHLATNTLISAIAVVMYQLWGKPAIPLTGHSLMGGFLSLLLVFRTNTAYARFYEARGIWSKTMETCRNLALTVETHVRPHSPRNALKLMKQLAAFPDALCYTCLSGSRQLPDHVAKLLPRHSNYRQLSPAMILCLMMHKSIHAASRESTTIENDRVEALHLVQASHEIDSLVKCVTSCEKIVRTPVPWSYSRHTSRFLTLWSGTLPFALVGQLGWLTIPLVSTLCWALFGIEEIGHLIEQPFAGFRGKASRATKTKPYDVALPVSSFASEIRQEVEDIAAITSDVV